MSRLLLAFFALAASPCWSGEPFSYDRQLAVELSKAYLRSNSAAQTIQLESPAVVSAVAAKGRRLVSISYPIKGKTSGAYVELEMCSESGLLTVVDVGTVDPLSAYRAAIARVDSNTYFAKPVVCPSEVP